MVWNEQLPGALLPVPPRAPHGATPSWGSGSLLTKCAVCKTRALGYVDACAWVLAARAHGGRQQTVRLRRKFHKVWEALRTSALEHSRSELFDNQITVTMYM